LQQNSGFVKGKLFVRSQKRWQAESRLNNNPFVTRNLCNLKTSIGSAMILRCINCKERTAAHKMRSKAIIANRQDLRIQITHVRQPACHESGTRLERMICEGLRLERVANTQRVAKLGQRHLKLAVLTWRSRRNVRGENH
jgi:hypothetical protein